MATGTTDGSTQTWNAATGGQVGTPLACAQGVRYLGFGKDGASPYTACADGVVRRWPLGALSRGIDHIVRQTQLDLGQRLDENGEVEMVPWHEWQVLRGVAVGAP